MMVTRRYSFALYPNKAQEAALERQAQMLAVVWNAALEQREQAWRIASERCGYWRKLEKERPKEDRAQGLSYYEQAREIKHIRAEFPEYANLSCASIELTLAALDLAFKAYWRRLKTVTPEQVRRITDRRAIKMARAKAEGRACYFRRTAMQDAAGYPRYKRVAEHRTIPHRDGSGWKLTESGKQWRFRFRGIPGLIAARGRFPAATSDLELRTMEIIKRDGRWMASVVVRMPARRKAGCYDTAVRLTLIDEFAQVTISANGECLAGPTAFHYVEWRIIPAISRGSATAPADPPGLQGDDRFLSASSSPSAPADPSGLRGDDRAEHCGGDGSTPADPSGLQGDDRKTSFHGFSTVPADLSGLRGGLQVKRFSWRWRRAMKAIARMRAAEARRRREALHLWTTHLIANAAALHVSAPPIKQSTQSAAGDAKEWGAAVETIALLNRTVLSAAPAMCVAMLKYKAAEAGIEFRHDVDDAALAVNRDLPETKKRVRCARKNMKETARAA